MAVFVRSLAGVIHYSRSSAREALEVYPMLKKIPWNVIPLPNFRHIYRKPGDAERGRRILNVEKGTIVLLAFRLIRRYKGVKELIDVFKKIEEPVLRLVVAGRPADQAYVDKCSALRSLIHASA